MIHQTWKDENIPIEWVGFVDGWKRYPHVLWTDEDLKNFMSGIPFWNNYKKTIEKIDAARYYILKEYGGIYVDLDFQLFKDITPLLTHPFVVGLEPEEHARLHNKQRIISNAFMASTKGSPFITHVCRRLKDFQHESDPLYSTGPFFLTKMYEEFEDKNDISVVDSKFLFPLVKDSANNISMADLSEDAYAAHHYWGSWWRKNPS